MTRREFLVGSGAFAFTGGVPVDLQAAFGPSPLRLGVISDIHVTKESDCEIVRKAFIWFREQGVDGVVMAGDFTNFGTIEELMLVANTWREVFPRNCGKDGRHVEKLFVCGNHDMEGAWYGNHTKTLWPDWDERKRHIFLYHMDDVWPKLFDEPWAPIWKKTVKGYVFVGAHWKNASKVEEPWGWHGVPDVEPFMKELGPTLDRTKPFFFIQHHHPKDTCLGARAWGRDDGYSTRALAPYPNAVAFSGHSHRPLTDETSVWQGAFTSINCSSLRYVALSDGRENLSGEGRPSFSRMGGIDSHSAPNHGMLVDVRSDRLVIQRREFGSGLALGPDWVIPLPVGASPKFAFGSRAKKFAAPEFPPDAKLGFALEKDAFKVSFPAAGSVRQRVFEYVVRVTETWPDFSRVLREKRVYSTDVHLPPEKIVSRQSVVFGIGTDIPPKARLRVSVEPLDSFGNCGRAITTEYVIK